VLRIAMESGFGSLSAFNKSFRKLAGMSPSDFRKISAKVSV
jgi:AraC-like DNA-binding protein